MKKGVLENFAKFTEKHLWFAEFLRTPFLQNTSGWLLLLLAFRKRPLEALYEKRCSWKFCKIHRKTPLVCESFKNTFFTEHLWTTASAFSFSEAATGGVLRKKLFLKISQNSPENTFGLRSFHLFWRTSANDCFCNALAPLTYFVFSTFFLIITTTTVNISDVCFCFKEFKSGISK